MKRYRFSKTEVALIRDEATRRVAGHRAKTWNRGKSHLENEMIGIAGELAVARIYHLSEASVWRNHGAGGDGGVKDLLGARGEKLEVKTTRSAKLGLMLPQYRKRTIQQTARADIFCLCQAQPPDTIDLLGWQSRAYIHEHATLRDPGRGLAFVLPAEQLDDPTELFAAEAATQRDQCDGCGDTKPGRAFNSDTGLVLCLRCSRIDPEAPY